MVMTDILVAVFIAPSPCLFPEAQPREIDMGKGGGDCLYPEITIQSTLTVVPIHYINARLCTC